MRSTLKARYQHYLKSIPSVQLSSYACQLSNHHPSSSTSIHHTSMHIEFKTYAMQASTCICTYQMQSIKVHELAPLLVCFSCPRILFHLFSSILLPLCPCPCPCPTSTSLSQSFPKLLYLCTISPPLSSISIKGVLLIDAKVCILGQMVEA